jgi:hypothetical protein
MHVNMNAGYGISGHKNSFSSKVKVGNYVEDQIGAKLAKASVVHPLNGRSEVQDNFSDPRTKPSNEAVPISPEEETQKIIMRSGLSYNLMFPHGTPGKEGTSTNWCTTNQLLHAPSQIRSCKVFEDGSDAGLQELTRMKNNEKRIELQKKLAREKRQQQSYVTSSQASSALVTKKT